MNEKKQIELLRILVSLKSFFLFSRCNAKSEIAYTAIPKIA